MKFFFATVIPAIVNVKAALGVDQVTVVFPVVIL